MMLLTRSRSTALPLRSSGSRYSPSPGSPSAIRSSGGGGSLLGGARLGRLALDELLADQRLRPDQAARVLAEVLERGIVDPHHDHGLAGIGAAVLQRGLVVAGHGHVGDYADVGPGDPDLLALDQETGVVEDRADLVDVVVAAGGRADGENRDRGSDGEQYGRDPPHGPGGTSVGSHSPSSNLPPRNGWSVGDGQPAFAWVAAPGQRVNGPIPSAEYWSNCCAGAIGVSVPPAFENRFAPAGMTRA